MVETLISIGLKGDIEKRALTPHEIDALTAALPGYLHKKRKTELIGEPREGYIVFLRRETGGH